MKTHARTLFKQMKGVAGADNSSLAVSRGALAPTILPERPDSESMNESMTLKRELLSLNQSIARYHPTQEEKIFFLARILL